MNLRQYRVWLVELSQPILRITRVAISSPVSDIPCTLFHAVFTLYLGCAGSNEGTIERKLTVRSQRGFVLKAQDLDVEFLPTVAVVLVATGGKEEAGGGGSWRVITYGTRRLVLPPLLCLVLQ